MGRLTRLSFLFLLSLGAGLGAFVMSGPASQAHPLLDGGAFAPVAPPAIMAPPTQVVVKAGDTLSAIGASQNRTWQQFAGWNHLSWSQAQTILVGQVLRIPPATYSPPAFNPPVVPAPPSHVYAPSPSSPTVASFSAPSGGFEACVIAAESSGNPYIMNASGHWGLYQFSYSTWVANGGAPGDWGHAGPAEQHAVFVRSSPSNWTPYDSC